MKITRGRTVRINLGNYEHVETSAVAEWEIAHDKDVDIQQSAQRLDKTLDILLAADIRDAKASTSLDDEASFVYSWSELRDGR